MKSAVRSSKNHASQPTAGVPKARVSYERNKVEVDYAPGSASVEQLEKAIQDGGYLARKT
jgi:hypothetical protein